MNRLLFALLLILLVVIKNFALAKSRCKVHSAKVSKTSKVSEPENEEPRIVDGFEAPDSHFKYQISLTKNNVPNCG